MKYTIEITTHEISNVMAGYRVRGEEVGAICKTFDIVPDEDFKDRPYVELMVPRTEKVNTVIYKQDVDNLDLAKLIITINSPIVIHE